MTGLPEWLWPVEDEEAVVAAERLIEETHQTLRRMEATMEAQRNSSQHPSGKSEKLKSALNVKINTLESGLKSLSESRRLVSSNIQPLKFIKAKPNVASTEVNSVDRLRIPLKPNSILDKQQHSLLLTKNRKTEKNVNTAEKEVLTARAKVQDALAVARNVSASLGQHVCPSSHKSKQHSTGSNQQVTNIGIFEVKSQADEKTKTPKMRLEQALLPSISIKRGLEMQSIPSIQVLPGEKIATSNVSVFTVKHADEEKRVSTSVSYNGRQDSIQNQCTTNICPSNSVEVEAERAIAQLSKQLAEVEELREINQAQVNHVLKFLLSRVCTQQPERSEDQKIPPTHHQPPTIPSKETKDSFPSSVSSSNSESNPCPIAYDSLSRFLETYKRAAEHNMLARKRAVVRKQKTALRQKKETALAQTATDNHLLIGPLRRTVKVAESEPLLTEADSKSLAQSHSLSNHSSDVMENKTNDENHTKENYRNGDSSFSSDKEGLNLTSYRESNKTSSQTSSVFSPLKQFREVSGGEYEDDWEEEEDHYVQTEIDKEEQFLGPSEQPIEEVEEYFHSSPNYQSQKSQIDPSISPVEPLETSFNFNSANQSISDERRNIIEREVQVLNEATEIRDMSESVESPVNDFIQTHHGNTPNVTSMVCENVDGEKSTIQSEREVNTEQNQSGHRKDQEHHLSSSCSSPVNDCNSRPPRRSSKWWDLKLREDIQLQSAILLNWQLEDRCKNKSNEADQNKDNLALQSKQREIIADVERRWQHTLDQLDQRLKSIEDTDRIHRLVNEIRIQLREEEAKGPETQRHIMPHTESKILMRDQIVQTSPDKCDSAAMNKGSQQLSLKEPQQKHALFPDFKLFADPEKHRPNQLNEDLTSELLAYSRMGILARPEPEQVQARSLSSSTVSSHFLSSAAVSVSDGEMRESASGSCSCSEGEFCMCGGRRRYLERGPPDGSYTFSDGENFPRDVSQGEIPPSQMKGLLQDTSHGEIGVLSAGPDPVDEASLESDDTEWEHR